MDEEVEVTCKTNVLDMNHQTRTTIVSKVLKSGAPITKRVEVDVVFLEEEEEEEGVCQEGGAVVSLILFIQTNKQMNKRRQLLYPNRLSSQGISQVDIVLGVEDVVVEVLPEEAAELVALKLRK
jgi:phage host-nuclease inhibitor protein Gam